MRRDLAPCRKIEEDLVATAAGDAGPTAARRVDAHVRVCAPCRADLERYRVLDDAVADLRRAPSGDDRLGRLRRELATRLADLRRRLVRYRVFRSPLGALLIARSEEGVVLVEYLDGRGGDAAARLARLPGIEAAEDGAEIEALYEELVDYLRGRRARLEWPLDLRLAGSAFHRRVLAATAGLPYGAVTSYAHIAREIGRPAAVRAVAQALRRNPVPIAVPCHRVIGSNGALVGYAGARVTIKERLLAVEGIPLRRGDIAIRVARETMYVRAGRGRDYCLPTCGSLPTLTLARLTLFATPDAARSLGLEPCPDCRPDLRPLAG
jgi:methylated-DNA-[protein]-cysteine S-methyltransferase